MLRVGLTGGIASGKSTVGRLLRERGAAVFDADDIVRGLYAPGAAGSRAVSELFGTEALAEDGGVDRARVAALVFYDPERRRLLETRIHPLVRAEIARKFDEAEANGARVAVAEASQIFEASSAPRFDRVLLVTAPEATRMERWSRRGGDPADARRRMSAQVSPEAAAPLADDVLVNDGTLPELARKVEALYREWTR